MNGIVMELQSDLISSNCDVLNALRKAKVIATKLNLLEFNSWIDQELNGYTSNEVPTYREVRGVLKAKTSWTNWQSVQFDDQETESALCVHRVQNSISVILSSLKNENPFILYPQGVMQDKLNRRCHTEVPAEFAVFVDKSSLLSMVEAVINTLLDWTLDLEKKGIVGEKLTFSEPEKGAAKELSSHNTNIFCNSITGSQFLIGENANAIDNTIGSNIMTEVKEAINKEQLNDNDKDKALQLLSEINEKIEQKRKPHVIRAVLVELKDFLLNAGATVTAALIQKTLGLN